jgi:photosystem II stability/assembly factor-like uncharacterized protein
MQVVWLGSSRLAVAALAGAVVACGGTAATPHASAAPTPLPRAVATASASPETPVLTGVKMIDAQNGWGLLSTSTGVVGVARSTDGGLHWTTVLKPGGAGPSATTPVAGDFHDAAHAWALELLTAQSTASAQKLTVVATADGGAAWTPVGSLQTTGAAVAVRFVDAAHGWVFALPSAVGTVTAGDTALYRTADAGKHWQPIVTPDEHSSVAGSVGTLPQPCSGAGPLPPPVFLDQFSGWIGGACDSEFFFVTRDGGQHWSKQYLPFFPGPAPDFSPAPRYDVDSIRFLGGREMFAVVHRGVTTGANALQDAALYHSYDGGYTWSAYWLPAAPVSVFFIDSRKGWMVAAGAGGDTSRLTLFQSGDSGRTWVKLFGPVGPQDLGGALQFVTATTGFVSDVADGIVRTTDGGKTWTRITPAIS